VNLPEAIENYISHQRSLGMVFRTQAGILTRLGRALGSIEVDRIDATSVQMHLYSAPPPSRPGQFATMNGFFRFALQRRLLAESPLPIEKPTKPPYSKPYIYSPGEIRRLLDASEALEEWQPTRLSLLPQLSMRTLILLLYGAGLRISEATSLTLDDLDLLKARLLVRNAKFGKSRRLPIGPKLCEALRIYVKARNSLGRHPPPTPAVFVKRSGDPASRFAADLSFAVVRGMAGIKRTDGAFFQPRLHDLRHTFAVHRLVAWYKAGANVQLLLPKLSTYLGHVGLAETQHYLTMTPELLREANLRFENYAAPEDYNA